MTDESTTLADWDAAIEQALAAGNAVRAVDLARVVLRSLPQRAVIYQQMVRALWLLRRWEEGQNWGRRLLQADPGNALAWRAVARAVEQRGDRMSAHATWQRAFEGDPYEAESRAGLARTSLKSAGVAKLDLACLATLYLRGHRWQKAVDCYRSLTQADPRRVDFALHLTVALWQSGARDEAYTSARRLVHDHPRLLLAWAVLDALGDEDDKALAASPLATMDPDGVFVRQWCALRYPVRPASLTVNAEEAGFLRELAPATPTAGQELPANSEAAQADFPPMDQTFQHE